MSFFIDVFLLDDNGGLYHRSGLIRLWIHRQYFIVGFGLYMGFADNKKIIEYHQTYPETFFFSLQCLLLFSRISCLFFEIWFL